MENRLFPKMLVNIGWILYHPASLQIIPKRLIDRVQTIRKVVF